MIGIIWIAGLLISVIISDISNPDSSTSSKILQKDSIKALFNKPKLVFLRRLMESVDSEDIVRITLPKILYSPSINSSMF